MQRTINVRLLNKGIQQLGGLTKASQASKVSISWLKQAKRGVYTSEPNPLTMAALCAAFEFSKDDLFPLAKGKAS